MKEQKKDWVTKADLVKWIVSDIAKFQPTEQYDCWHDRAAFHFLTSQNEIAHYINIVSSNVNDAGFLIMGTFSNEGPTKCSGIEIKQYSTKNLANTFSAHFNKISCEMVNHTTPFNTVQSFCFCKFQKK